MKRRAKISWTVEPEASPAVRLVPIGCWPPASKARAIQYAELCWELVGAGFKGADAQSWIWLFRWAGFRDL